MKTTSLTGPSESAIAARVAPGPKGCLLFGSVSEMSRDAIGLLSRSVAEHGDIVRMHLILHMHLVIHPDFVQQVLQSNHTNYKKDMTYDRMKPLVGEGLLTSDGDFWRRQRRLSQPAFHKQRLAGFAQTMSSCTTAMLDGWHEQAKSGAAFDVSTDMMGLALRIVGLTLFSADLSGTANAVGAALTTALEITNDRFRQLFVLPKLPTAQNRRFNRAVATLDGVVNGVIESRRASGVDAGDLLSMLMAARDEETGEGMSDRQLRDEMMTLFLAGHETTANLLSWTWYLLSKNPAVERRLAAEVDEVLSGRVPTVEDLPKLRFTMMVIEEAMRLYPPAWLMSREAIEEDEIGGYRIPKKGIVMLSPYLTHRHPAFWDNPEGFDPERFLPERVKERPRYAYFPFGGGPRQCIGNNFALMEAQIIIAMVVQRYRLHLVSGHKVEPDPTVTLRPGGGVKVTLKAQRPVV